MLFINFAFLTPPASSRRPQDEQIIGLQPQDINFVARPGFPRTFPGRPLLDTLLFFEPFVLYLHNNDLAVCYFKIAL